MGYLATGTRSGLEVDRDSLEQALSLRRQQEAATRKLGRLVSASSSLVVAAADWNFVPRRLASAKLINNYLEVLSLTNASAVSTPCTMQEMRRESENELNSEGASLV